MSFREILYKWIVIADAAEHSDLRSQIAGNGNCLIAYTYCDHEKGISAMTQHSAAAGKAGVISGLQPIHRNSCSVIRYSDFKKYNLFILSKKQSLDLNLPASPGFLAEFFNEEYHDNRGYFELDPFRVEGFPDDLFVKLPSSQAADSENIPGIRIRLEKVFKETGEMEGLVISSNSDSDLRAGQKVGLVYRQNAEGFPSLTLKTSDLI